jgi:hypothetical protein
MTAMSKTFTPQEFIEKLTRDELTAPLALTGMVKTAEESSTEVMFAIGSDCAGWTSVPLNMIDNVEVLGVVPCKDHTHHRVRLTFNPPTSPEGTVFAALLNAATTRRQTRTRVVHSPDGASSAGASVLRQSGCPCNDYEIDADGQLWVRTSCEDQGDGSTICTFEKA